MDLTIRGTDSTSNEALKATKIQLHFLKLHSAKVRYSFQPIWFNFVHFSLGRPWECSMSQVKHEDTNSKLSTEILPRPSYHIMTRVSRLRYNSDDNDTCLGCACLGGGGGEEGGCRHTGITHSSRMQSSLSYRQI